MANRLPKSYVVPSLGLLMVSVPRADPGTHRILVENSSPRGNESVYGQTLLKHYGSLRSTTYVHEWGHIIQNVMYPYLYVRNVRELSLIETLLSEFQQDVAPTIGTEWSFDRDVYESLTMDVTLFRVSIADDGSVSIGPPGKGQRERNDISEVDLIEEANSIFEFKVETGDYGSGEGYYNWLKRGPRYTRVYKLLSKLLGQQDAYHLLPALVVASYHTTYPVTAFASLVGHIVCHRNEFDVTEPAEAEAYFVDRLMSIPAIQPQIIPKLLRFLTDDSFAFVGPSAMRQYIEESEYHPLNLLARRLWIDQSALDREWIYHPHQFIKHYGLWVRGEIRDLQPPFTWFVYDSDDVPLSHALFVLSEIYRGKKVSKQFDPQRRIEFHPYLEILNFRRVLVQGLFRDPEMSRRSRYCHHEGCDYFNSGLCNGYIHIPDVANDCTFPRYVLQTIKRRYSKESNSLERTEENGTKRIAD